MFAGCGGGGSASGTSAAVPAATSAASITAQFSFALPGRATSAGTRRTAYISPSSQSIEIDVAYGGATALGALLNIAPLPSTCTVTGGIASCALSVVAQASATNFIITFFDQPNGQGDVLSTATVPVPVAVNGVANVSATLLPVAASVTLSPNTPLVNGIAGSSTLTFTAEDAAHNPITGTAPFNAPIKLVPVSPAITFTPNIITSPVTVVTVTYSGAAGANTAVVAQTGTTTFTTLLPIAPLGTPTQSPSPVALTITPAEIGLTVGQPGVAVMVSLTGAPGPALLASSCAPGAQISLSRTSVPAGTPVSVTVTAVSAPSAQPAHACTLTATAGTATASTFVDVTATSVTISGRARTP